jgi:hypothetical protein
MESDLYQGWGRLGGSGTPLPKTVAQLVELKRAIVTS